MASKKPKLVTVSSVHVCASGDCPVCRADEQKAAPLLEAAKEAGRERSIPDYLEGREGWSRGDFVLDALARGYTKAQADRFATQYLWKLGKLTLTPPEVDGFRATSDMPVFKDGGQVAFLFRSAAGRRVFRFFTLEGKRVGPEHGALAAAVVWQMKAGWVSI